jgi:hypothetical protein
VVDVLVAASRNRQALLKKLDMRLPAPVAVRAIVDTGSALTGFRSALFRKLGIQPFTKIPVRTPSTQPGSPHIADQYDVSVALIAGGRPTRFLSVHAISSDDFDPDQEDGLEAILGRDILDCCNLFYLGPEQRFELGW